MIGIMGASGSGKSTLLNSLVGKQINPDIIVTGTVRLNGHDRAFFPPPKWQRFVGYVEQDDLLYPQLTPRETLIKMATLQYSSSPHKIQETCNDLLHSLSLEKCADSMVGIPGSGISGGERKRLAIALQLIADPYILFLDEPTSGLDAHTALQVISTLATISKSNHTKSKAVLMTIHQPRLNILTLFSKILLLSENGGRCIFFGNLDQAMVYFAKIGFPCPMHENPADHFLDSISKYSLPSFEYSLHITTGHSKQQLLLNSKPLPPLKTQLSVLLWQNSLLMIRDKFMLFSILFQSCIFALFIGFTVFQLPLTQASILARLGILFFLSVNTCFGVVQPIIIILPLEKGIVTRERFSNSYSSTSALICKFLVILPLRVLSIFLLCSLVWLLAGLHPGWDHFGIMVGIVSALTLAAVSIGFFIGAVSPSLKVSQVFAPLLISLFMIYGGNMSPAVLVPRALSWLQYVSPVRYAYMSLCQNEFRGLEFTGIGYKTGEQVLDAMDMNNISIGVGVLGLVSIAAVFMIGASVFFHIGSKPRLFLKIEPKPKEINNE